MTKKYGLSQGKPFFNYIYLYTTLSRLLLNEVFYYYVDSIITAIIVFREHYFISDMSRDWQFNRYVKQ